MIRLCTLVLLTALMASPLLAQPAEETAAQPPQVIASQAESPDDADIAARIRGIFGQIQGLQDVTVDVSAGVVTLEGVVAQQAQADRAEAIAARVAGVVTVQNDLERDLAVETNVAPALDKLRTDFRGWMQGLPLLGVALIVGAAIALFGHWLARRERLWAVITSNVFLAELASSSVRVGFTVFGAVIALQILGATALMGAVLGGAGVVGIALGFAMRDTVDNYVSSVMLSVRQPFRANDHIVIDDKEGRVIRLTSRATILMTLDGNHLRIPNAIVFKSVILNYTRNPQRRFQFELGVDADDDAVEAMAVGVAALKTLAYVLDTPEPSAVIQNVGDSNIVLRFYGWVDQRETDFNKGRSVGIQTAKTALEKAGFSLPEPIYRLRFDAAAPPPLDVKAPAEPRARQAKGVGPAPPHDTAPEPAVERMVREERAETGDGDLLDDSKPVE